MLATKDCESSNFTGLARRIVAVPIPRQDKSLPADAMLTSREPSSRQGSGASIALAAIGRFDLDPPPRILITGKYLAGGARRQRHIAHRKQKRPAVRPGVAKIH